MYPSALLIPVTVWKQPKCPSGSEWINYCTYSGVSFKKLKRNECVSKPWKNMGKIFNHVTKATKSQSGKVVNCIVQPHDILEKNATVLAVQSGLVKWIGRVSKILGEVIIHYMRT